MINSKFESFASRKHYRGIVILLFLFYSLYSVVDLVLLQKFLPNIFLNTGLFILTFSICVFFAFFNKGLDSNVIKQSINISYYRYIELWYLGNIYVMIWISRDILVLFFITVQVLAFITHGFHLNTRQYGIIMQSSLLLTCILVTWLVLERAVFSAIPFLISYYSSWIIFEILFLFSRRY